MANLSWLKLFSNSLIICWGNIRISIMISDQLSPHFGQFGTTLIFFHYDQVFLIGGWSKNISFFIFLLVGWIVAGMPNFSFLEGLETTFRAGGAKIRLNSAQLSWGFSWAWQKQILKICRWILNKLASNQPTNMSETMVKCLM